MSARRSLVAKRARRAARQRSRRSAPRPPTRYESWHSPGSLVAVGWVAVWALLLLGSLMENVSLAVAASVTAVVWAGLCVTVTYQEATAPRFAWLPRKGAPRRRWWSGEWWVVPLIALFVSPAATHWLVWRTGGGKLRFADADPETLAAAQQLGWVAVAVVLIGCPAGWLLGRRTARDAT